MLKRQRQGVKAVVVTAVGSNQSAECNKNTTHLNFMNLQGVQTERTACPAVMTDRLRATEVFPILFKKRLILVKYLRPAKSIHSIHFSPWSPGWKAAILKSAE